MTEPVVVEPSDLAPVERQPGDLLVEIFELRADVRALSDALAAKKVNEGEVTDRKGAMQTRFLLFLLGFSVLAAFGSMSEEAVLYIVLGAAGASGVSIWGNVKEWEAKKAAPTVSQRQPASDARPST